MGGLHGGQMATTRVASLTSERPSLRKSVVPVVDHDHESHQERMGLVPLREVGQAAHRPPPTPQTSRHLLELGDNTSIITGASFSCTLHRTSIRLIYIFFLRILDLIDSSDTYTITS